MQFDLYLKKSVDENASLYFEKAKKAKKKLEGAQDALDESCKQLGKQADVKPKERKVIRKREWFEKFRWFFSSDNILVILGRDATTNEILIKKHTEEKEHVLHAETAKSPFCVVKSELLPKTTETEAAIATASFSGDWKEGLAQSEVFLVKPEQVSKQAQAGEYIAKGAFMIYGKKKIIKTELKLAVGILEDKRVMCGPITAVKKHCKEFLELYPGNNKMSEIAKKIKYKLGGTLDEIIKVLPAGGASLK